MLKIRTLLALATLLALTACGDAEPPTAEAPTAPAAVPAASPAQPAMPANHPPVNTVDLFGDANPRPAPAAVPATNRGSVLAVHQTGGYSYVRVQQGNRNIWLAGPPLQVAVGETVAWGDAAPMNNFTSKSLGRTFSQIFFVSSLDKADALQLPDTNRGRVVSVTSSGGYQYLEVDSAAGQRVWVAAQVAQVGVGDEVSWVGGAVMRNFTSSSLGRTFDQILFTTTVNRM